jgi:hypothetical protein
MARTTKFTVRCPHAKPEDLCVLPAGVRYCLCYGDQQRDHVGRVSVQGGQLLWSVLVGGRARGWYSYVAVVRQGAQLVPLELQDEPSVRETVENGRAYYVLRGPREQRFEVEAAALVEAAVEGKEVVDAVPAPVH